jgi:DNA helicase-2/ATP-dependent DNA helicase PcrA
VLEKNQRSTTPILQCSFSVIEKNPPVFAGSGLGGPAYRRSVLKSAREEKALGEGKPIVSLPIEIVPLAARDFEAADIAAMIEEKHGPRCPWSDFAVLYRSHFHRDELAAELGERGIPFSIENMDVMDTSEVRDLLACLGAVNSVADAASLLRVAALPQFRLDPEKIREAMRVAAREQREGRQASLASLLREIDGGPKVLEALQKTREEISGKAARSRVALDIILRDFGLDPNSPSLTAFLKFVEDWEQKAITHTGEIGELLDYLVHFREARGAVCLQADDRDAVRLMTAHSAKGLEFRHVSIIRATAGSFPAGYKESLVAFPQELRDADSLGEGDAKALHDQEERRLFYVAMTRARDTLALYGKQGIGKDKTPPGFMRELLKDVSLRWVLVQRSPREFQTDLFGSAAPRPAFVSRTAEWLSLPPAFPLNRLSATAVENYEVCPLQFKLEREWRLPRDVPAAMQYGASIHRVLRTYFDSMKLERPLSEPQLIDLFEADLGQLVIEDPYQRQLYHDQGVRQLRDFLDAAKRSLAPKVLHTEEHFEIRIGHAVVAGRIDRIDDLGNGRVVIVDYKTGKPRAQADADNSLQLSLYAIAAREKWGYQAERLVFYNLEENSAVTTVRDQLELEAAKAKVQEVASRIEAGEFDPKTGYHCRLCPYRNLCPATEKHVHISASVKEITTN